MSGLHQIVLNVDDDDYRDINAAIARWQRVVRSPEGVIVSDGESDLAGAIVGEICRGWIEYFDLPKEGIDDGNDD